MIGLAGLRDGGHLLEHPEGPMFAVIRSGRIQRAQLWIVDVEQFADWPGPSGEGGATRSRKG